MDWRRELRNNVTTAEEVFQCLNIEVSKKDLHKYNEIIDKFPMSVSQYYLSLINPEDEDDVIRRMCVPSINETDLSGSFDTSGEKDHEPIL
jgi:lysine 2,3-aminomutase